MIIVVSVLQWWREIGFRRPETVGDLSIYLPAFALALGNMTFGVQVTSVAALLPSALLAAASGFVEEVIFRGLILRSLLPRGEWKAVVGSAAFFGLAHAGNVMAGSDPSYVILQIAYSMAIGFGFGAMALKGRLIWPLVGAHALGKFVAFINNGAHQAADGQISVHLKVITATYALLYVTYGLYLMRTRRHAAAATDER